MHARYVALLLPTMFYLSADMKVFKSFFFFENEVWKLLTLEATILFVCLLDLELNLHAM